MKSKNKETHNDKDFHTFCNNFSKCVDNLYNCERACFKYIDNACCTWSLQTLIAQTPTLWYCPQEINERKKSLSFRSRNYDKAE